MSSTSQSRTRRLRDRLATKMFFILFIFSSLPVVGMAVFYSFSIQGFFYRWGPVLLLYFVGIALLVALVSIRFTRPLKELVDTFQLFTEGNPEKRAQIRSTDEVGKLAQLFNEIADEMANIYQTLASRKAQERNFKTHPLEQLSRIITSSNNLNELVQNTLLFITKHYGLACAAVYLVEQTGTSSPRYAKLFQVVSPPAREVNLSRLRFQEKAIEIDTFNLSDGLVKRALLSNRPFTGSFPVDLETGEPPVTQSGTRESLSTGVTDTPTQSAVRGQEERGQWQPNCFEAAVPIAIGDKILGALDLYALNDFTHPSEPDTKTNAFTPGLVSVLHALADMLALAVANFMNQNNTAIRREVPEYIDLLYKANYQIAQAETIDQVIESASHLLTQLPFISALLLEDRNSLRLVYPQKVEGVLKEKLSTFTVDSIIHEDTYSISVDAIASIMKSTIEKSGESLAQPTWIHDLNTSLLPQKLLDLARLLGCEKAVFLPSIRNKEVLALLMLGSGRHPEFDSGKAKSGNIPLSELDQPDTPLMLQPFQHFIDLIVVMIKRIQSQLETQRKLTESQTLVSIVQTLSSETDLLSACQVIHIQVQEVMGPLDSFAIALYDSTNETVRFPYMIQDGHSLNISSFSLEKGLISSIIRTGRPLMLVEDTERQLWELAAEMIGYPAKSWLGVPLQAGGEIIGAIIAQDAHREHRFTEEDQIFLSTLAAQVAVVIRNLRSLENNRRYAHKERLINEITSKLHASNEPQVIIQTAVRELRKALHAQYAQIIIQPSTSIPNRSPIPRPQDEGSMNSAQGD